MKKKDSKYIADFLLWGYMDAQQNRTLDESKAKTQNLSYQTENLADDFENLKLINQALWEIMSDKLGLSGEELLKKVEEIDLRDGVRDGRISKSRNPWNCTNCNHLNSPRMKTCVSCHKQTSPLFG